MIRSTFASNLKFLRRLNNQTQTQLSDKLGVKRNKISSYESGFAEPNLKLLINICELFNISLDKILLSNIESDKGNFAFYQVNKDEYIKQSLNVIINDYFRATNEAQKVFDGISAYKSLEGRIHNTNDFVLDERLFEILKIMLDNNWKLIEEMRLAK